MIPTLIRLALSQRWLVLMLAGMLVALGVWAFQNQKIDAYPDISGQMVQIITTYPGRAAEEVERPGHDPLGNRHAQRPPRGQDPLADDLRAVDRGGDVRRGRGELLGPAAGQGEARRGHAARRREAGPRPAGHRLRRDLSLRAGLRRHARPDGAADAARLGGGPAAAPLRGRGRRRELRRLPEAIHGDLQSGPVAALQPLAERRHRRPPEQQFQRRRQRRRRGAACRS